MAIRNVIAVSLFAAPVSTSGKDSEDAWLEKRPRLFTHRSWLVERWETLRSESTQQRPDHQEHFLGRVLRISALNESYLV